MVQVQAILYASLAASLLSAFLAMLGKQWLNQYARTDMRGTAIERSQNRQRKLDGIVAWYFDHVMESLPLMLQIALLLLGCALSRCLWEIDIVVASVVLGVTSFGVAFYTLIVVAGTVSESCPYQTPGARLLRYTFPTLLSVFATSQCCRLLKWWCPSFKRPWFSMDNFPSPLLLPPVVLVGVAMDPWLLGRATLQSLAAFGRMVCRWVMGTHETRTLDLRCVSWVLRTSLDKADRLSALEYLATMTTLVEFNPAIVADCFNVMVSCMSVGNGKAVIVCGSEQLAIVSTICFLRTLRHLLDTGETSSVLEDVRRRYDKFFPPMTDFWGLPLCYAMAKINNLIRPKQKVRVRQSPNYGPFSQEHTTAARGMAEGAQTLYQQAQHGKVPRWILHFALHSLSLDPLPPTPVVADYLSIIAIDLGCDLSGTGFTTSDERHVHFSQITISLTLD